MTFKLSFWGIFLFSIPSILATVLEPINSIVDTALVGNFDSSLIAYLAISITIFNSVAWTTNFLVQASIQSLASQLKEEGGSKNTRIQNKEIHQRIKMILYFALGLGLVLTLIFLFFKTPIYSLAGVDKFETSNVDLYYLPRSIFFSLGIILTSGLSVLRGLGLVKECLKVILIGSLVNIFSSYILIYHAGLGLSGVAFGTIFGQCMAIVSFFYFLQKVVSLKDIWNSVFIKENLLQFSENSLNLFIRSFTLMTCFFIAMRISKEISNDHLAAHQILLQFWLIPSYLIDGFAMTANILGAQYFGNKNKAKLNLLTNYSLLWGLIVGLIICLIYFVFKSYLVEIFIQDADLLKIVFDVWPVLALAQIVVNPAYIYDGVIFGMGMFRFVRNIIVSGWLLVFLPLSIWAYREESLEHIWLAIIGICIYRGILSLMGYKIEQAKI